MEQKQLQKLTQVLDHRMKLNGRIDYAAAFDVLTKREKAEELGVSVRTLDRWTSEGRVHPINLPGSKRKWFLKEAHAENNS